MKAPLLFATSAFFLAWTVLPGLAQQPSPKPQQDRIPAYEEEMDEPSGMENGRAEETIRDHQGIMMGGMGERGMIRRHWMHHRSMMNPVLMRMIFALMDSDGDGTVSLQEWQAAHEKIFRAMDPDKDGTITFEEMMNFLRGGTRTPARQMQPR